MIDLNELKPDDSIRPVPSENLAESVDSEPGAVIPVSDTAQRSGNPNDEVQAQEARLSALKRKCMNLATERELALALAAEPLIPGVSDQLVKLLKDRIVAEVTDDHEIRVRSRDGRPVADAVKDWLGSAEYRHFRTPGSRGGVLRKSESTMHSGTAETVSDTSGRSLNEMVIERWKHRTRSQGKDGLWPRIP
ncbi:hypothetical protein GC170_17860 [bacterium]|nr:hypothetical protein [bacterium]